jgi:regulator of replication initiation timing
VDITIEDLKNLTFELYMMQRDNARLQQENAELKVQLVNQQEVSHEHADGGGLPQVHNHERD